MKVYFNFSEVAELFLGLSDSKIYLVKPADLMISCSRSVRSSKIYQQKKLNQKPKMVPIKVAPKNIMV